MGKDSRRNGGPVLTNPFKKRNDGPTDELKAPEQPQLPPPEPPPLLLFTIRQTNQLTGEKTEKTVYAHGLGVDEARMISFYVFFITEVIPGQRQLVREQKLVLNADSWDEVEQNNPEFPQPPKGGIFH